MRQLIVTMGVLFCLVSFAACNGGGANVGTSFPATNPAAGTVDPTASLTTRTTAGAASELLTTSEGYSYTAPWGGFAGSSIYLDPQGPCQHISASLGSGYSWPSFVNSLPTGRAVTIYGTPSFPNGWSKQNNCPTGGIVATNVALAGASPSPSPAQSPSRVPNGTCNLKALTNNASWSAACQFAVNGPWHQRIPNNATSNYAANSGGVVAQLLNSGAWNSNYIHDPEPNINQGYDNGGGYPNYVCQVGDGSCVRMTLSCTSGPGWCSNSRGTVNGLSLYFPKYGIPENNGIGGHDNHMSVLDCVSVSPSCREINLYNYSATMNPPAGGYPTGYTMRVGAGDYTDPINSDGWGSTSVGGEVTVAGATLFAGQVRSSEIASGVSGIRHAIPLDINCGNTSGRVYPATGTFGHGCSDQSNAAQAGSRFYWDESCATISGRPIDAWSKALLCALHNYGGYAVDTNGYTSISFAEDAEMPFGGITGYRDYVTPFAKSYGSYLGFSQYGGMVYAANLDNDANGLSASVISAHLHLLRSCVNGPAGSQGSC